MTTNSLLRVMVPSLVLLAACKSDFPAGSYDDGGANNADAMPADQAPASDRAQSADAASTGSTNPYGLNLAGLTAVAATTSGGFPGLPNNACSTDNKNVLTLVFQTRVLSWEHCAIDPNTGNAFRKTETQLLTDYEVTAARLLLDLLSTNYNRTACGADKGLETLDLTFADRVEKYQDDFYAGCPSYAPVDGRTYLHYMDLITSWLDELARDSHPLPSSFINLAVVSDLDPFPSSAAMTAATAACGAAVNPSYDVTAATQTIKWSSCASGSTGYGLRIGGRVLSESEFARVMQSWSAIQLGAAGDCSTPRSQKSVQLTTAPGVYSYLYLNDVTPCSRDTASAYSMYVVGLDDLAALLASLASGSPPGDTGVPDLSPAPKNCSDITDQQSCENAACNGICEWSGPFMNVTSAPGGPLLTEVRVTSGWCTPDRCSTSRGSPSCSSLSVTTTDRTPAIGTTCDLVAVAADGRTQSFRITVVQSGPAYNQCCGSSLAPYSGQWVTFASLAFDPPEVVVDFNRDGGVPATGDAGGLSVDQVLRACAIATSCSSAHAGLAMPPSVFTPSSCVDSIGRMGWLGGTPYDVADPTIVARLMACAKNSDCTAFRACFGGGLVTVSRCRTDAICRDNVLTSIDGSFDCSSIGTTCQGLATNDIRACCNEVLCQGPPTVTCHGTSTGSLCDQSWAGLPFDCSLSGRVCSTDPQAVCQGTGPTCAVTALPTAPTCSGSVATYCSGGRLATYDCAQSPLLRACDESALYGMPCKPSGTACSAWYNKGECDGPALLVCVDGEKVAVSCPDLGFAGCAVRADGVAICN